MGFPEHENSPKRILSLVEYALHDARKPIGVATYEIRKTLPLELQGLLPKLISGEIDVSDLDIAVPKEVEA